MEPKLPDEEPLINKTAEKTLADAYANIAYDLGMILTYCKFIIVLWVISIVYILMFK